MFNGIYTILNEEALPYKQSFFILAERVGFEPTVQCNPYDDLANRSFRPLRHLSFYKGWQKYKSWFKLSNEMYFILNFFKTLFVITFYSLLLGIPQQV